MWDWISGRGPCYGSQGGPLGGGDIWTEAWKTRRNQSSKGEGVEHATVDMTFGPKGKQTCLRSQSFSQILQTLKHSKCDGAGPQRKTRLCSAWGTACWDPGGQGTPKDSEKCSDVKCLPVCGSNWFKCTGDGVGLLEINGGEVSDYPRRTHFNGRNMKQKSKIHKIWHSLLYGSLIHTFELNLQSLLPDHGQRPLSSFSCNKPMEILTAE